jgi:uncharacterized repeat protein (TIGR01451 family)
MTRLLPFKLFVFLVLFTAFQSRAQYNVSYENSFRNWLPGQDWVILNNDTISAQAGLMTRAYNGEVLNYMLGFPVQSWYSYLNNAYGHADRIVFSPPVALGNNPYLKFYSAFTPGDELSVWLVQNQNDTTLAALTDSITIASALGYNVIDLQQVANSTVRIAFRMRGDTMHAFIDDVLFLDKYSNAYIPDSCFRNYLTGLVPAAMSGDSLDYTNPLVPYQQILTDSNSCIHSLEGIQYFSGVQNINFSNNQIDYFPPVTLTYAADVRLHNNLIDAVPDFPYCTYFDLDNNLLRNVVDFSEQNVAYYHARNNLINGCIPCMNRFVDGNVCNNIHTELPCFYYTFTCSGGSAAGCNYNRGIVTGKVYYDMNQNSVFDSGEIVLQQQRVNFYQGPDLFTNAQGIYSIRTDSGLINMEVTDLPPYFSSPTTLADTLSTNEIIQHDFPVIANTPANEWSLHLNASGHVLQIGQMIFVTMTVCNEGTLNSPGIVSFQVPSGCTMTGNSTGILSNDSLICSLTLAPFECTSISFYISADSSLQGTMINLIATAVTAEDFFPLNNSSVLNVIVPALNTTPPPHDPNDKTVSTPRVNSGFNGELTYCIRFENTGLGNATRVMIRDYLPSELDYSTFDIISSSHPCIVTLGTDSTIQFSFYPILLTPVSIDSIHASGYVWFRIKPRNPVYANDTIFNTADIFFDNEAAVTTPVCKVWADSLSPALTGIQISPSDISITPGGNTFITVYAYYDDGSMQIVNDSLLSFICSDTTVASVNGLTINGINTGTAVLTADYLGMTATAQITVDSLISNVHKPLENIAMVYPNPARDVLTIKFQKTVKQGQLQIMNTIGEVVQSEVFATGTQQKNLDLSALVPGIYFLTVMCGDNVQIIRVCKY